MMLKPVLGFKVGIEDLGYVLIRFPVLVLHLDTVLQALLIVCIVTVFTRAGTYKKKTQLFR